MDEKNIKILGKMKVATLLLSSLLVFPIVGYFSANQLWQGWFIFGGVLGLVLYIVDSSLELEYWEEFGAEELSMIRGIYWVVLGALLFPIMYIFFAVKWSVRLEDMKPHTK